jgi:hypothetical protein
VPIDRRCAAEDLIALQDPRAHATARANSGGREAAKYRADCYRVEFAGHYFLLSTGAAPQMLNQPETPLLIDQP